MAIFTPGIAVGQISGRVGGSVFSHNRGGAYVRNGSIPSVSQTAAALQAKAALAAASQIFSNLSDADAATWREYAANHPQTNRLGRSHVLSASNWCVKCNGHLIASGDSTIDVAPVIPAPAGVAISSAAISEGGGTATITLATTPLGANYKAWIRAARVQSGRIVNVKNKLTTVLITTANIASPIDIASELEAVLGTFTEDDWYHFEVRVLDTTTGLISGAFTLAAQTAA